MTDEHQVAVGTQGAESTCFADDTPEGTDAARCARIARLLVELVVGTERDGDVHVGLDHLIHELVDVLPPAEAGVLLLDEHHEPGLVAATDDAARDLETQQLRADQGPCIEAMRTGRVVMARDLDRPTKWPALSRTAVGLGFRSILAVPMRTRAGLLGCVNFFFHAPRVKDEAARTAEELVDVAALSITTREQLHDAGRLVDQLTAALQSRVVIEQAKGVLSERLGLSMHEAFGVLRRLARSRRMPLHVVARAVIAREVPPAELRDARG